MIRLFSNILIALLFILFINQCNGEAFTVHLGEKLCIYSQHNSPEKVAFYFAVNLKEKSAEESQDNYLGNNT